MRALTVEADDPRVASAEGVHAIVQQFMLEEIAADSGGKVRGRRNGVARSGTGRPGGGLSPAEMIAATLAAPVRTTRIKRPSTSTDLGKSGIDGYGASGGVVSPSDDGFFVSQHSGSPVFLYQLGEPSKDITLSVRIATVPTGSGLRIYPRLATLDAGSGPIGYMFTIQSNTFMLRETNGAFPQGAGFGIVPWAINDLVEVEAIDNVFRVFRNKVLLGTFTDPGGNVYSSGAVAIRFMDLNMRVSEISVQPAPL